MATLVTGFVIDAIQKRSSVRIGAPARDVREPVRTEVDDPVPGLDQGDRSGDLPGVDLRLHGGGYGGISGAAATARGANARRTRARVWEIAWGVGRTVPH